MAIATGAISTAVAVFEMNRPSIAVMTNKLPTRDVGRLNTAQALGDRFQLFKRGINLRHWRRRRYG